MQPTLVATAALLGACLLAAAAGEDGGGGGMLSPPAPAPAPARVRARRKGATLKPISACCAIPELAEAGPLQRCSEPRRSGPCDDVQCVFEQSGFLSAGALDREAFRAHLRAWARRAGEAGAAGAGAGAAGPDWAPAVEAAIRECVERELRQYLDRPCRAYDVFTCTSIALLKKCPKEAWIC